MFINMRLVEPKKKTIEVRIVELKDWSSRYVVQQKKKFLWREYRDNVWVYHSLYDAKEKKEFLEETNWEGYKVLKDDDF